MVMMIVFGRLCFILVCGKLQRGVGGRVGAPRSIAVEINQEK